MARRWYSRSYSDSWGWYPRQATVHERASAAVKEEGKLRKKGQVLHPVRIQGRTIARSFWGKAWCSNLERYSDYSNRLPRGRSYLSSGQVLDLRVEPGRVIASVMGTRLYRVDVTIDPLPTELWQGIVGDCTGRVASMVDLLRGKLSHEVMDRVTLPRKGLFPTPAEIHLSCSCPDWASMCKHVAATLYGVGARLDEAPELLFVLRGVSASEMVVDTRAAAAITRRARGKALTQDTDELSALFGIEMDGTPITSSLPVPAQPQVQRGVKRAARPQTKAKPVATKTAKPVATKTAKAGATKTAKSVATKTAKSVATKTAKSVATKPATTKPAKSVATRTGVSKAAKPVTAKAIKTRTDHLPLVTQEELQANGITPVIVAHWENEGYLVRGRRDGTWHATAEAVYRMANFLPKKKRVRR